MSKFRFCVLLIILSRMEVIPVDGQCTVKSCTTQENEGAQNFDQFDKRFSVLVHLIEQQSQFLDRQIRNQVDILRQNLTGHLEEHVGQLSQLLNVLEEHIEQQDQNVKTLSGRLDNATSQIDQRLNVLQHLAEHQNQSLKALSYLLEKQDGNLQSIRQRLQEHDMYLRNLSDSLRQSNPVGSVYECREIRAKGQFSSGVHQVSVLNGTKYVHFNAYCEFGASGESWLVFQRREDGSKDFYRTWDEYARGFGDLNGEFWLGNEILHLLTSKRSYKIRIELEDWNGTTRYADYSRISVASSADSYRLNLGNFSGGTAGDSFAYHNGSQFTTKDVDRDSWSGNCAQESHGGWWFNSCHYANLNGRYLRGKFTPSDNFNGVIWRAWLGYGYSLKKSKMKISAVI